MQYINHSDIRNITDTADVYCGFKYWFDKLLAYCLNIFEYDNLPYNVTTKDIEQSLILQGYAVYSEVGGVPYVLPSQIYGVGVKWQPNLALIESSSFTKTNLKIGIDCEVIYNCDLEYEIYGCHIDGSLKSFIARYARLLADTESTFSIDLVNKRSPYMPVVDNDVTKKSVVEFFKNIIRGKRAVVSDTSILNEVKSIQMSNGSNDIKLMDILLARDKILEQFYREIGTKFYNPKKAQITSDELDVNNQALLISTDDLLKARQEGINRINSHYGTNIIVKLNEKFNVKNEVFNNEDI